MAVETTAGFTGNILLDGIMWGEGLGTSNGVKWSSPDLTYSFSGSWQWWEKAAVTDAFNFISEATNLTFDLRSGSTDLTFNQYTANDGSLGFALPPDLSVFTEFGTGQVYLNDYYTQVWSHSTLEPGGYGFITVIHETLHALGLGHPHDNAFVFPGVSDAYDTGDFGLNTNFYTVMSYNDYGQTLADGTPISPLSFDFGHQVLGALDIAALQHLYGANDTARSGDNVYFLPDIGTGGHWYESIWDTGGTDEMRYSGSDSVTIDLRAATLDIADGALAGGAVSKADGVYGGRTIANGVVIENATGGSAADILTGNSADNLFIGNAGDDVIDGGAGNDTSSYAGAGSGVTVNLTSGSVSGGHGSDTLTSIENVIGSAFDDILTGSSVANTLLGGGGNDTITGGGGDDILGGGSGDDLLDGGTGFDAVSYETASAGVTVDLIAGTVVGAGADTLISIESYIGSGFADAFVSGAGADTLDGGAGSDSISYASAGSSVSVNLLAGSASGGGGNDTLANFESVIGTAFNDTLVGNAAANLFLGGAGNDMIDGGSGSDTASYAGASASVVVDLNAGTATGGAGNDTLTSIENIVGSDHDDTLTGTSGANILDGGAGVDTVSYAAEASGITASFTSGTVAGGGVTDTISNIENLTGTAFADSLAGDGLANVLIGGDGDDFLFGGLGDDTLNGGAGTDRVSFAGNSAVVANLADGTATGAAGTDTLSGIEDLVGSASHDTLTGDAGANVLMGDNGNDTLIGGGGNDMLVGGRGTDILDGGAGSDSVSFSNASSGVTVDLNAGTVSGGGTGLGADTLISIENVVGTVYHDTFVAGADTDSLDGGSGSDTVSFASIATGVTVNLDTGVATGGVVASLVNIENIVGSAFDDILTGGSSSTTLVGGLGDDILDGGAVAPGAGANDNYASYAGAASGVTVDLVAGTATGGAGNDTLINIAKLIGSDHDDTFIGTNDSNFFMGGQGVDTVSYVAALSGVTADIGGSSASGGSGSDVILDFENIIGSDHDDILTGSYGANRLEGGAGNDSLSGEQDDDTLLGGAGNDILDGGAGVDTAELSGVVDDYIFDRDGNGNVRATHAGSGDVDTFIDIELVSFTGGGAFSAEYVPLTLTATSSSLGAPTLVSHSAGNDSQTANGPTWGYFTSGGSSQDNVVSATGQYIAVHSRASDLVSSGGGRGAYLYDQETNDFTLISPNSSAVDMTPRMISADGNRVVVQSATSLVSGISDQNARDDLYLYTVDTDTFQLIDDTTAPGLRTPNAISNISLPNGGMSADGRFVVFNVQNTSSDGMISGGTDGNGNTDVYLFDADTGTVTLVSHAPNSATTTANDHSQAVDISADGQFVLFNSESWNIVSGVSDNANSLDTYLFNRLTNEVTLISDTPATGLATSRAATAGIDMTPDGRYVLLESQSVGLVSGATDLNGNSTDVFVYDTQSSTFDLLTASNAPSNMNAAGRSTALEISDDGRFVLMQNFDNGGGVSSIGDIYLFDRESDQATLVTHQWSDPSLSIGENAINGATMSADGRYVMFASREPTVVPNVTDGARSYDVFLYDHQDGETTLLSSVAGNSNQAANGYSSSFGISDDGSRVYIYTQTTTIGAGVTDVNGIDTDIYVYNLGIPELVGALGNDVLTGSDGANIIRGLAGNDSLDGGAGDDTLNGGDGNDTIDGGTGNDTLTGGAGDDIYIVDSLDDVIIELAGGGTDTVRTTLTDYVLPDHVESLELITDGVVNATGGSGDDSLSGGSGNDTFNGGAGGDAFTGGAGTDAATYADAGSGVAVDLAHGGGYGDAAGDTFNGIENIIGSEYGDSLGGDGGDNTIWGNGGDDWVFGANGDDFLFGGAGHDWLSGGRGADALDGGDGTDTAAFFSAGGAVALDLANGGTGGEADGDTYIRIENIVGSRYSDTLTGNSAANRIDGGRGADRIDGAGGNDFLTGSEGNDRFVFGTGGGHDTIVDFNGGTGLGDRVDVIDFGIALHSTFFALAADVGSNVVVTFDANTTLTILGTSVAGLAADDIILSAVTSHLEDNTGDDILTGGATDDVLDGGAGNDILEGGAGADTIHGGDGMDTVSYDESSGGVAVDLAHGGNHGDAAGDLFTNVENISGSAHGDSLVGDGGANAISGNDGADWLNGASGDDVLRGDGGNDSLFGGVGDDVLFGGAGSDTLNGAGGYDTASYEDSTTGVSADLANGGNLGDAAGDSYIDIERLQGSEHGDSLTGNSSANRIEGDAGNDWINGAGGDDVLVGGRGNDWFAGGAGDDLFIFENGDGADAITDFVAGAGTDDILDVSAFGFSDINDLLAASSDVGANVSIALDSDDNLTLIGVNRTDLHTDDFLFS